MKPTAPSCTCLLLIYKYLFHIKIMSTVWELMLEDYVGHNHFYYIPINDMCV